MRAWLRDWFDGDWVERIMMGVLALLIAALLAGVTWLLIEPWWVRKYGLKEGEIYEHGFRPAHEEMIMMPIIISTGKSTMTTLIPMWFYYPDSWHLSIKAYDAKKEKWRFQTYYVNQGTFQQVREGMWFCMTPDCQTEEPKIKLNK